MIVDSEVVLVHGSERQVREQLQELDRERKRVIAELSKTEE